MDYHRIVKMIPVEKREKLSTKLTDFILKSKNADKMPGSLAKTLLHHWQQGPLTDDAGLAVVLEVAVTLESDKTLNLLGEELQLSDVVTAIRAE